MNNFRSLIYTIVGIVIFIAVFRFFIYLLPFLIIVGLVIYLVYKVKKIINNKGNNSRSNTYKANESERSYKEEIDNSYEGQVVDVDFEEVNK